MSFDHARAYLFTLYASSKEQETDSAGRFGVGFWSVLLSNPVSITVSSKAKGAAPWKIRMDGDLKHLHQELPTITHFGTRIVVTYATGNEGEADRLTAEAKSALIRYCRYLRRNDKAKSPLPVRLNGEQIDRPFTLDSPCWMTFSGKHIEGAVGLTETPGVEVYAQGLPVWQGTVIAELKYGAKRQTPVHLPKGLAPYYLVNGHDLNVTYDRRAIVDDRALRILRRESRLKMNELLRRYLDQVSPRPFVMRFADSVKRGLKSVFNEYPVTSIGIILLIIAALTVRFYPENQNGEVVSRTRLILTKSTEDFDDTAIAHRPLGNPMIYNGPTTELPRSDSSLSLVYAPKTNQAFRIAAMEILDDTVGIISDRPTIASVHPPYTCNDTCLSIAVALDADTGTVILPVPSGHMVAPSSVKLDGQRIPLFLSTKEEPLIQLSKPTKGTLTYFAGTNRPPLSPERRSQLLALPEENTMPDEFAAAVKRIRNLRSREDRIEAAMKFIETRIEYDASRPVSEQYDSYLKRPLPKAWMPFVFTLGKGDCDVKNTLLVHLLRSVGIPARLAVGPIGEQGKVIPLMHAWVEFFLHDWRVADATGGSDGETDTIRPEPDRSPQPDTVEPEEPVEIAAASPSRAPVVNARITAPAPAATPSPATNRIEPDRRQLAGIVFGAAMVAGLLLILSTLFVSGKSGKMITPSNDTIKEEVAAKIAAGALAFPEWWHLGEGLKRRPILPVIGHRKTISIAEAERLAERGALFVADKENRWLDFALKAKAVVLDGRSTVYKQVASLLPSITQLDDIDALSPKAPAEVAKILPELAAFTSKVNAVIKKSGVRNVAVYLSDAAGADTMRELNVAPLGRRPGHLIVLSPGHSLFVSEHPEHTSSTALRIYNVLDTLSRQSDFLSPHRDRLLKTAASRIWERPA